MFDANFNRLPYTDCDKYFFLRDGLIKLSSACPNVYIADSSLSTPELIQSSILTSSFTGSVVVESLLHGVPCFSSGDFFFQVFPGVISHLSDLSLAQIEKCRVSLQHQSTEKILSRLNLCMFPGLLRADHHFKYDDLEHSKLAFLSAKSITYLLSHLLLSF